MTVTCDGRPVRVAEGLRKWAETEASIVALDPVRVEALDATGAVLRVCDLREDGEVDGGAVAAESAAKSERMTELAMVARLVLDATDRGAQRHAAAYETSSKHLVELVQILATRLGGLEAAWQDAMNQMIAAKAEAAEAGGGAECAAFALLGQAMAGQQANAASNGKAKA